MYIEIVDNYTIDVFGSTSKEAHNNAIEFYHAFLRDNWASMEGSMFGKPEKGKEWKYRFTSVHSLIES